MSHRASSSIASFVGLVLLVTATQEARARELTAPPGWEFDRVIMRTSYGELVPNIVMEFDADTDENFPADLVAAIDEGAREDLLTGAVRVLEVGAVPVGPDRAEARMIRLRRHLDTNGAACGGESTGDRPTDSVGSVPFHQITVSIPVVGPGGNPRAVLLTASMPWEAHEAFMQEISTWLLRLNPRRLAGGSMTEAAPRALPVPDGWGVMSAQVSRPMGRIRPNVIVTTTRQLDATLDDVFPRVVDAASRRIGAAFRVLDKGEFELGPERLQTRVLVSSLDVGAVASVLGADLEPPPAAEARQMFAVTMLDRLGRSGWHVDVVASFPVAQERRWRRTVGDWMEELDFNVFTEPIEPFVLLPRHAGCVGAIARACAPGRTGEEVEDK